MLGRQGVRFGGKGNCCGYVTNSQMLEDAIRLLKLQESYDKDLQPRTTFVGMSVNDTLFQLILCDETSKSARLQSTFKIADDTFYHIKLRALVSARRWDDLRQWSGAKKPPIGFEVSSG